MIRAIPLSLATLAVLGLGIGPAAAGCFVCLTVEGGPMECNNSIFETGGSSCETQCRRTIITGIQYCYCLTSGICGGGASGCDGGPCPNAPSGMKDGLNPAELREQLRREILLEERLKRESVTRGETLVLDTDFLTRLGSNESVAAPLLSSLLQNGRLHAGSTDGYLSVQEPADEDGRWESYAYHAVVRLEKDVWQVEIDLEGHPQVSRVTASFERDGRPVAIEIFDEILRPQPLEL